MKVHILTRLDSSGWTVSAAEVIGQAISEAVSSRGVCYVRLTGGNTAERLYACGARTSSLPLARIHFLLGDERYVSPEHAGSNYALVMGTLLAHGRAARVLNYAYGNG